jgi:hypothetical protein
MVTSAPLVAVELEPAAMILTGSPLSRACSSDTSELKAKLYSPLITAGTSAAPVVPILTFRSMPCFLKMPTSSPRYSAATSVTGMKPA